ncbi:MAG TPA: polyphosphate polymerase domain-containing protein [bacterium]|nr:polyphosphate polymerase domain-containing protein [bacterium]
MIDELTKTRRYELKYTIDEHLAEEIKADIRHICSLDENVGPGETGYIVNNLYFDTPDFRFYYDTKFKKATRFKPRIRFYGEHAKDLIWPEIKYRHDSIIWKKRHCVPIGDWPGLLEPANVVEETQIRPRLDRFEEIIHWYGARPVLHVRYFREPYVADIDSYGRVTFDRRLCYRKLEDTAGLNYDEKDMMYYDDPLTTRNDYSPVILEIKVKTLVPVWVVELIRRHHLNQRGFSKYCYGIDYVLETPGCRIPILDPLSSLKRRA